MKKSIAFSLFVSFTCACLLLVSCATNPSASSTTAASSSAGATNGGHLMVGRIANFGSVTMVLLSVDGTQVASIARGQKYDGYLTPGQHTISATIAPNNINSAVWTKTVNIEAGKSYSFTAKWQADNMVLVEG